MMGLLMEQREKLRRLAESPGKHDIVWAVGLVASALLTLDESAASNPAGRKRITRAECSVRIKRAFDEGPVFTVVSIQSALRDAGYDPGPLDGEWGPLTAGALSRFLDVWRQEA